jgi:hypothetical protein
VVSALAQIQFVWFILIGSCWLILYVVQNMWKNCAHLLQLNFFIRAYPFKLQYISAVHALYYCTLAHWNEYALLYATPVFTE